MCNEKEVFIQLNTTKAHLVHAKLHYHWTLSLLLEEAYEAHIQPDGTLDKKVIKQLKAIKKQVEGFLGESRIRRKDRWIRHVFGRELSDIHLVMVHLRQIIMDYKERKDTKCQDSQKPTSKPSNTCCQTDQLDQGS